MNWRACTFLSFTNLLLMDTRRLEETTPFSFFWSKNHSAPSIRITDFIFDLQFSTLAFLVLFAFVALSHKREERFVLFVNYGKPLLQIIQGLSPMAAISCKDIAKQ